MEEVGGPVLPVAENPRDRVRVPTSTDAIGVHPLARGLPEGHRLDQHPSVRSVFSVFSV